MLIAHLLRYLGKSAYVVAQHTELDPASLRRAARHFSAADAKNLLALVTDDSLRKEYAALFHRAELLRQAGRLRGLPISAFAFDQVTPRWLLNELGRGQSRRTGGKSDYFTMMLFRMQLANGDEPKVATYDNLRTLYDTYVARVRIARGEVTALRNAIILFYAYLDACPLDTAEQRHALLGIAYIAIDLAAQVNDYRWLRALAKTLSDVSEQPFQHDAERVLRRRLILDAKSRADRYSPQFERDPALRLQAGKHAQQAVEPAEMALRSVGDLAYSWPEVTCAWVGSYFGLLNHGINVGWPPDELREMFKRHDDLVLSIRRIDPGATFLTEGVAGGAGRDPYAAEFLSTLALARENPAHNLRPRGTSYKRAFEPDSALWLVAGALANVDPGNRYGDSIVGALQLCRAEALLCQGGRFLSKSAREGYEDARREAQAIFARLNMPRKLRRLDRLELRAGIVRSEECPSGAMADA
jgi:hypothetical protein